MYHELLLALAGSPGDLFTKGRGAGRLRLVPGLPFLHPTEEELLNRLAELGSDYSRLAAFEAEFGR